MIGRAKSMLFVSLLIPLYSESDSAESRKFIETEGGLHALNYCVNLMPSFRPFAFLTVEHDSVFDLDVIFQHR
jgi:hypothetical protein